MWSHDHCRVNSEFGSPILTNVGDIEGERRALMLGLVPFTRRSEYCRQNCRIYDVNGPVGGAAWGVHPLRDVHCDALADIRYPKATSQASDGLSGIPSQCLQFVYGSFKVPH